jgi:Complex 1 protein (LYR family)
MSRALYFYKALMRNVESLERSHRSYYYSFVRQHFEAHLDEDDAERIETMIDRAENDALWVLNKYNAHPPESVYDILTNRLKD